MTNPNKFSGDMPPDPLEISCAFGARIAKPVTPPFQNPGYVPRIKY